MEVKHSKEGAGLSLKPSLSWAQPHNPHTGLLTSALSQNPGSRAAELSNHQMYILPAHSWNSHASAENCFDKLHLQIQSHFLRKFVTSTNRYMHTVNSA